MINVSFCQIYFAVFHDLTLIKEMVIARVHFVISNLKFRSHNFNIATFYQWISEHVEIFFRNSNSFLKFLSSNLLILHDVIRIV